MRIDQPSFSGSITQDLDNAYTNLSGSFTGSVTGSFKGEITVDQASFVDLEIENRLTVGTNGDGDISLINSGSIEVSGSVEADSFTVDGTDVLDSAIAFAIALG